MRALDARRPWLSRRLFVRGMVGAALLPWVRCDDEAPAPAGEDAAVFRPGACPPFLTPLDDFFVQFGARATVDGWQMPELDASAVIELTGLFDAPTSLTLADLEADVEQHVTVVNTLMCVLGFRSTAIWTGVPLRVVLDRAGIDRDATRRVRFTGADGFRNNLKLEDIYDSPADVFEPLLAFRIHGEPLRPELGFPVRLLLNDRFGFKNTKWLASIEATDSDEEVGQYQERGYPDAGVITPVPIVENLLVNQQVPAGPVELCGFALSGHGAVDQVEVAVDGGAFEPAELTPLEALLGLHPELADTAQLAEPARYGFPLRGVWSAWRFQLALASGEHAVDVRLRDSAGNTADATTHRLTAT